MSESPKALRQAAVERLRHRLRKRTLEVLAVDPEAFGGLEGDA